MTSASGRVKLPPKILDELLFYGSYFGEVDKHEGQSGVDTDLFKAENLLELVKYKYAQDERGRTRNFYGLTPHQLADDVMERYDQIHPKAEQVRVLARNFKTLFLDYLFTKIMVRGFPRWPISDHWDNKKTIDCLCAGMRWINYSEDANRLHSLGKRIVKICDLHDGKKFPFNAANGAEFINLSQPHVIRSIYRWLKYAPSIIEKYWRNGSMQDAAFKASYDGLKQKLENVNMAKWNKYGN
ncbi:MAG: hypothetical protein LQ350_005927 [Teloschistes chrysophthalmus]|nr:MAG: hypothetical protein LQ350_005927 [Niorma chrysophthalma]